MTKPEASPLKLSVRPSVRSDARFELVFEDDSARSASPKHLLAPLKALGESGGAALGNAYALLASTVLYGIERLEDLNAERRLRARSPGTASNTSAPRLESRPRKSLPPPK